MREKVNAACKMLKEQGHTVQERFHGADRSMWFEIDGRMLASWEEMSELADRVYSLSELEDLFKRRAKEEGR